MEVSLHQKIVFEKPEEHQDYAIVDAEWNDAYGSLILLKKGKKFLFCIQGEDSIPFNLNLTYPMVRWIDASRFLVINSRADEEANAFIMDRDAVISESFHAGDGIQDVVVGLEGIWVSYFDEGVFGSGISEEGLVLFDFTGEVLFRYHSDLANCPNIDDCYAMAKGEGASVWILPYSKFPLVHVNGESKTAKIYKAPLGIHRSDSMSIKGNFGYFFESNKAAGKFYAWEIGKKKPQVAGKLQGRTRGLAPGETNHFISFTDDEVTLTCINNSKEKR